jgi:hypothetical protein
MRHRAGLVLSVVAVLAAVTAAIFSTAGRQAQADDPNSAPDPYHVVNDWAKLPDGRHWGMAIGVKIDRDGTSVWVFDRCGGKSCDGSNIAPIQKFDSTGRLVVSRTACSLLLTEPCGLPTARIKQSSTSRRMDAC